MKNKSFIRKVQLDPMWTAAAEIFFAIGFTFGPIAILSIPFTNKDGSLTGAAVGDNFWSYWTSGELALPILSLCGAIAAVAVIKGPVLHRGLIFLAWSLALVFAIACGFVLSASDGFEEKVHSQIVWFGFGAYAALLVLWVTLSGLSNRDRKRRNPEERAYDLLREKNQVSPER